MSGLNANAQIDAEAPVPDVHEARLDGATLRALLTDIETLAVVTGVSIKGAPADYASDAGQGLGLVADQLLAGRVRGVQIRYRHGETEWTDTLMNTGGMVRLVRIAGPA